MLDAIMAKTAWKKAAKIGGVLYALFVLLCGVGLFALATYTEVLRRMYEPVGTFGLVPTALLFLAGAGVIAVGIVGLRGVITERPYVLTVFSILSTITLLTGIAVGILCYIFTEKAATLMSGEMDFAISRYQVDQYERLTITIDVIQSQFHCCGYHSFLDWENHPWYSCSSPNNMGVSTAGIASETTAQWCHTPGSCCWDQSAVTELNSCLYEVVKNNSTSLSTYRGRLFTRGCRFAFKLWVQDRLDLIGIVSLAFTVPHIVGQTATYWMKEMAHDRSLLYHM